MKRFLIALSAVILVTSFAVDVEAGLFGRRKAKCCQPACCEPAPCCQPVCCEPAPCCAPAPAACGCEVAACGCESSSCCHLSRREQRRARRQGCCVQTCSHQAPACGCEVPAACGSAACGSAPCGCEGTVIESAPAFEGAAPEAAPEAPVSDSTT